MKRLILYFFLFFFFKQQLYTDEAQVTELTTFYKTQTGEKIMDPHCYTNGILKFLEDENQLILNLVDQYDYLFEIGCGPSFRAKEVVKKGCRFYGIDINKNFIKSSQDSFVKAQIEKMAYAEEFCANDLTVNNFPIQNKKKTLILFPFNLLGNLADFHIVLENMIDIGEDFCFSIYKINEEARKSRLKYYTNCGCQQIRYTSTPVGDLFNSKDGLHSASFKVSFIIDLLDAFFENKGKKATIAIQNIGKIGYFIYVKDIRCL